jgi:hypothetical protein
MATKILCVTPTAITGDMATFSIDTDVISPFKYHWKKNGAFIPAAPSAKTYTTPPLAQADLSAKFSVVVYGQDRTEESNSIAINADAPTEQVTVADRGVPKPAWQPFKEEGAN